MIIGTNFKLSSAKFLDDRQLCKDYNTLITNAEGIIYPPGFEVFCEYENKYYQYVLGSEDEYIWEERRSGVSDGESASIKDDTISEKYTWSSAHIDSMRIDLETLITQANDYTDEIDERVLYIEGKLQWFESFDGSYESLTNKPVIPEKISELEDDMDIEGLKNNSHTHINKDILETITEEMINSWNNNVNKIENYNDLFNKPIENIGIDIDLTLNPNDLNKNIYLIKGIICGIQFTNELCIVEPNETKEDIKIIMLNSMKKIVIHKENENWSVIEEENYGIDKNNAKISNSLNIGEGNIIKENNQIVQGRFNEEDIEEKYINIIGNGTSEEDRKNIHTLDWEGNGWYGGKLSQEGIPTEDKDLITKGYADDKYETITNVNSIVDTVNTRIENINTCIDNINKENARRDVIIEALANGRRRTVETDGNDVDLMFSTEKDKVWIDKIEGETLVNVCDQEEPIAITKSYTVEGTNHVPLQGEYDGKARPVVHGNTLVNHNVEYDKSIIIGEKFDNRQGTEILNFEGTPNCEIKVDIDGHTAINLSTKKEDILCKSFDSVSGNEINLVAEENSVSDLVIQGNTMVNLVCHDANKKGEQNFSGVYYQDLQLSRTSKFKLNTEYTIVLKVNFFDDHDEVFNRFQIGVGSELYGAMISHPISTITYNNVTSENSIHYDMTKNSQTILAKIVFTDFRGYEYLKMRPFRCDTSIDPTGHKCHGYYEIMIFEGDLTQTPELIPTEYVEGLKSTFEDKLIPYSIYNGDNLTSITETQYQLPLTVKSNTQYTVTTTANTTKYQYAVYSTDGLTEYLSYSTTTATQTFTCDTNNVYFKVRMNPSYEGNDYSFVLDEVKDKFLIVEGDWSSRLDLLTDDYFGKYRVDMSSHGKNLFDKNNINELRYMYLCYEDGLIVPDAYESLYWIKIKPSTTYTISKMDSYRGRVAFSKELPNLSTEIRLVTGTENNPPHPISATSLSDENYLLINGYSLTHRQNGAVNYGETITKEELLNSIQIEEGSTVTEYEPYHGSSKTVYLNSPLLNGDELLTKDGKLYHYHKMGKVVLDGSEDWILSEHLTNNVIRFWTRKYEGISKGFTAIYCDKFIYENDGVAYRTEDKEMIHHDLHFNIVILKSKLGTTDVNGFKQWLSENPTTVVYELAEPWYEPIGAYGKVVLDGSEDWYRKTSVSGGNRYAYTYANVKSGGDIKATNLTRTELMDTTLNTIYMGSEGFNVQSSCTDVTAFKQWLQQNPQTVIYELANPQLIDEDMRFNIATNSTIEYQSNVPMANTQFLPYRNELPLLESSTQYRVTFDCDVEGLELMVSLGGTSQTITSGLHNELSFITPSLQTDGKLTIDGYGIAKIDNVLITKGDMEYKYFEGLKSGFEDRKEIKLNFERGTFILPTQVENGYNATYDELKNKSSDVNYWNNRARMVSPISVAEREQITIIIPTHLRMAYKFWKKNKTPVEHIVHDSGWVEHNGIFELTIPKGVGYFSIHISLTDDSEFDLSVTKDIKLIKEKTTANIKIQNSNAPIFGKGGRL